MSDGDEGSSHDKWIEELLVVIAVSRLVFVPIVFQVMSIPLCVLVKMKLNKHSQKKKDWEAIVSNGGVCDCMLSSLF